MAGFTDSLEDQLLETVLNSQAYSPPANRYIALFTTLPQDDGTGGVEVVTVGTNYARVLEAGVPPWKSDGPGERSNNATLTFPQASAAWGTILGFGLYDASTGGNLLMFGSLATPKSINNGDQPSFAVGALQVSLD